MHYPAHVVEWRVTRWNLPKASFAAAFTSSSLKQRVRIGMHCPYYSRLKAFTSARKASAAYRSHRFWSARHGAPELLLAR